MEPWEITTVYADGRTETRMATPDEVAQREADLAAFEAEKAAQQLAIAEAAEKRAALLKKLGITEEEAQILQWSL